MAIPTIDQMLVDVKQVLPIYADTDLYDEELIMLIRGAISKLDSEGVSNVFEYGSDKYYDYLTCIRYQVATDIDLDIDIERLKAQYITRVNTLRCTLNHK